MANTERDNSNQAERELDKNALDEAAKQGHERIAEQLERRSPESRVERNTHGLQQEALEQASVKHEKETNHAEKHVKSPERARKAPSTKRQRDAAFTHVMDDARSHMTPTERTFSKVIHNPAIEKVSEVAGNTIVRPNAILSGSISAFVIVLGVLLIARHYGYPLSGTETIIAFVAGWIIGIVYDFLHTMITGKR